MTCVAPGFTVTSVTGASAPSNTLSVLDLKPPNCTGTWSGEMNLNQPKCGKNEKMWNKNPCPSFPTATPPRFHLTKSRYLKSVSVAFPGVATTNLLLVRCDRNGLMRME